MSSALNVDIPSGLHFLLIFFYLVLAQVSFLQLSRLIYYKHPLLSFQAWFLLVSLAWCGERAVTFIWSPLLSQSALTFLWVIPSAFQCISFSLLVLYSRFLLNQHRWSKDRFWSLVIYFSLNIVISIATVTMASLLAWPLSDSDAYVSTLDKVHTSLYTIQFTALLVLYGYYAYHLHRNISASSPTLWHRQQSTASSQFWVSLIALSVFFTQWLYYVLATIDPSQFRLHITSGSDNILDIQWPVFLVIVVWEIVPTALVLFVSRQIPTSDDTLLNEIRYHGFFKAVFCCPTTRSRRGMGNGGMLYENLTNNSDGDRNGGNADVLLSLGINASPSDSIFGNGSNIYPHQASYHVLNEDGKGVDSTGAIVLGPGGQGDPLGAHDTTFPSGSMMSPPNAAAGLMMDYGLVDGTGAGGNGGDQKQQKAILQQLQSYSHHALNESTMSHATNSDLRGLPVMMGGTGKQGKQGNQQSVFGQDPNSIGPSGSSILTHNHRNNNQSGNLQGLTQAQAQAQARAQANSLGLPHNQSDLLMLNQHLAAYNYDDGGDLF